MCMCKWFCQRRRDFKMLLVMGPVREAGEAVKPTPQYHKWPLKGELLLMFQLTNSQQVNVTIDVRDRRGQPAAVDGVPQWFTNNTDVLALTPSEDGKSCLIVALGPLGEAGVSVEADADLGAGVTALIGTLDVQVTAGQATTISLTPGTPEEQPEGVPVNPPVGRGGR